MKKTIVFLVLLAGLVLLGACSGTETIPSEPVADSAVSAPDMVVYLNPT